MRLLAACVLTLCLVVSGCGHDDTPASPIATTTTSPPANEGVEVPSLPAQAKQATPEGAASFIGYYVKLLEYASLTGDVSVLANESSAKCEGCQRYVTLYRDTYRNGGYFKDGAMSVGKLDLQVNPSDSNEVYAAADLKLGPSTWRTSRTAKEKQSSGSTDPVEFTVKFGASWSVTQFGLRQSK